MFVVQVGGLIQFATKWQGNTGNLARLAAGTHPSQKVWTCEHCGKTGKGSGNYKRHHGDVCKQNYNV